MSELETWLARGAVSAMVAAIAGLFLRVRTNEGRLGIAEKTLQRYEATEKVVGDIRLLTARIDERLAHLPKHGDLERLHDRISKNGNATAETTTAVAELTADVRGLRDAVDRLHDVEKARAAK